jgi:hypothetical protein
VELIALGDKIWLLRDREATRLITGSWLRSPSVIKMRDGRVRVWDSIYFILLWCRMEHRLLVLTLNYPPALGCSFEISVGR